MGSEEENLTSTPPLIPTDQPKQQQANHSPSPLPETQSIAPPVARVRGDDILSAIESIPEKVVAGIRETTPKRTLKETPQTAPVQQSQATQQAPAKKTFAEWWFGLS